MPPEITAALSDFDIYAGLKVSQVLTKIVRLLDQATAGSRSNPVCVDNDYMDIDPPSEAEDSEQEFGEEEDEQLSDGLFDDAEPGFRAAQFQNSTATYTRNERRTSGYVGSAEHKARMRSDLREVKRAGFHIGHHGQLFENGNCFLVISIRISKLGIPEDALKAWHLEEKEYLMLLIQYLEGYKTTEELLALPSGSSPPIQMRVGICQKQKVSLTETIHSFTQIKNKDGKKSASMTTKGDENLQEANGDVPPGSEGLLRRLFIGEPLKHLLEDRLVKLLRYRTALAMSWAGAEAYYNDHQGRSHVPSDGPDAKYWAPNVDDSHLPKVVTSDHLLSSSRKKSFPVLAMQFLVRHLVRCTEFCLVCHCRIDAQWEALMPYVCDKPLCLYQYMALGFGPSIEYTILTQPYVVDLLISFCYAAVSAGTLKDFPVGMGLTVPHPSLTTGTLIIPSHQTVRMPNNPSASLSHTKGNAPYIHLDCNKAHKAMFDQVHEELIFPKDVKPLRVGQWICILPFNNSEVKQHRRVLETFYPNVRLGPPITVSRAPKTEREPYISSLDGRSNITDPREPAPVATPRGSPTQPSTATTAPLEVQFLIYDQNFDDLSDTEKMSSIRMLLDTLPSVLEMKSYLQSLGHKHTSLETWGERLPVAAIGVLRWVIASNRSCIIQIDDLDNSKNRGEDRVPGMQQYMQFRFAQVCPCSAGRDRSNIFLQGAPDKEQRFITSVREATARLNLKYPTLFAWHGSNLSNWHGIVREGLHFKQALHGRAYGNGVYFSTDINTSLSYSHFHDDPTLFGWPKSELMITHAICLNEIVNVPAEFVSRTPHLVVAQLDWIQTRYLFVKCTGPALPLIEENAPAETLEQDPQIYPKGPNHKKISMPITAISKARRPSVVGLKIGNKKSKVLTCQELEEEKVVSDDTDWEDEVILLSDNELDDGPEANYAPEEGPPLAPEKTSKPDKKRSLASFVGNLIGKKKSEASKTEFEPGTLDHSNLPLLAPPSYATPLATKTLQRELRATLKLQETHPADELGWYLDAELITNVYQWIVELHSFEDHLPLARDMKSRGVKSIVLELRFGKGFPYSPPFVRVIRPRFLPFLQGGGGHVTAGGALVSLSSRFPYWRNR